MKKTLMRPERDDDTPGYHRVYPRVHPRFPEAPEGSVPLALHPGWTAWGTEVVAARFLHGTQWHCSRCCNKVHLVHTVRGRDFKEHACPDGVKPRFVVQGAPSWEDALSQLKVASKPVHLSPAWRPGMPLPDDEKKSFTSPDRPDLDVIPRLPADWELSGAFLVFVRMGFPWIALAYTVWSFLA